VKTSPRFPWRTYAVIAVLVAVVALLPLLTLIFAEIVASMNGCHLSEGTMSVCMVGGSDWGELLYSFYVLPWLLLATLPLGGGALLVLIVILFIHYFAWRRLKKDQA
jgi:ABC-type enterochelin transport system permease subunit